MLKSLELMERAKNGDKSALRGEPWLAALALSSENRANVERFSTISEFQTKTTAVFDYVLRQLRILDKEPLDDRLKAFVEEAVKWSEVAKCGMRHQQAQWRRKGFSLFAHNEGSAEIYASLFPIEGDAFRSSVCVLIRTHGLVGQAIRGEVQPSQNAPLRELIKSGAFSPAELRLALAALNKCVIGGVSEHLWKAIEVEASALIEQAVSGEFADFGLKERLMRLRASSIAGGEDFEAEFARALSSESLQSEFEALLRSRELWYVEAALRDFSFEEFCKVLILALRDSEGASHVTFEPLMRSMYYDYEGKKTANIYKKRVIEKFLSEISLEGALSGKFPQNPHASRKSALAGNASLFDFAFSPAGEKLIEFCVEAEKSGAMYEKAIILLFDFFGLRRDQYDRFHNEARYLSDMNASVDYKRVMLDYAVGDAILDVGPGGGAMLDLIEEALPGKKAIGVDISANVIEALQKKKRLEKRGWDIVYGDALNLKDFIAPGSVQTILFSSILHELYSYIPFEGKKFNRETLRAALKSAFGILPSGGRIVIRDGIMTEPKEQNRIIKFLDEEGFETLKRYAEDFQGRSIQYKLIGLNEALMPVNDAMEFLYTYTWGPQAYVHEINEQFGYFAPSEYQTFILETLGEEADIKLLKHFLQEGYTIALSPKIGFFDESRNPAPLPDSTCLIVIEKR